MNPESCEEMEERRSGAARGAWGEESFKNIPNISSLVRCKAEEVQVGTWWGPLLCWSAWWLGELEEPPEEEPAEEMEHMEDFLEPREEGEGGGE